MWTPLLSDVGFSRCRSTSISNDGEWSGWLTLTSAVDNLWLKLKVTIDFSKVDERKFFKFSLRIMSMTDVNVFEDEFLMVARVSCVAILSSWCGFVIVLFFECILRYVIRLVSYADWRLCLGVAVIRVLSLLSNVVMMIIYDILCHRSCSDGYLTEVESCTFQLMMVEKSSKWLLRIVDYVYCRYTSPLLSYEHCFAHLSRPSGFLIYHLLWKIFLLLMINLGAMVTEEE